MKLSKLIQKYLKARVPIAILDVNGEILFEGYAGDVNFSVMKGKTVTKLTGPGRGDSLTIFVC